LRQVADRSAANELDRTGGRFSLPGNELQQGRLAGAIGADEPDLFTRWDRERDVVQDANAVDIKCDCIY